jgi:membrane-bound serine protease (ClpP class)
MKTCRVSAALIVLAGLWLFAPVLLTRAASPAGEGNTARFVDLITIDGSINPASADFIIGAIDEAKSSGAAALVIELDTPGGMLNSTRRIVRSMLGAPVPVIVYVSPSGASAASAGMFITIAAHICAMAPGTTIGAAHPVEMGGGGGGGEGNKTMEQKLENFAASFAKSIAEQRGHNQKWAEDAVRHSAIVGEQEALSQHVIDIIARDITDLLAQANGREVMVRGNKKTLELKGAAVRKIKMSSRQRVLDLVADPNLVYLLLMAGIVGLYFEFAHPGVFLPGVAGAICILLALTSFEVLPISAAGLILLLLGVTLLIAEGFVPSYGIFGIGGVVAFVLGSLFLIDTSQTDLVISRPMIAGAAVAFSAIILGLGVLVARGRRVPVKTGLEGMVGEVGEVVSVIAPGKPGRVFVHGEIWRATSDQTLEPSTRVQVISAQGMELRVRAVS